jgi:transposase InsO family protein
VKYAWIKDHVGEFPIAAMCRVIGVARSAFNAWRSNPQRKRDAFQAELARQIEQIQRDVRGVYGSPRVTVELNARGRAVSENAVARCMKVHGIRAKTARRFVPRTTDSDHAHAVADNVLDRKFQASASNRTWVCDITYIPTDQGWLYLAGVMDLFSRKIVGWSMDTQMRAELVSDALAMALQRRKPEAGLLHHSDRGVQYASEDYQQLLKAHGIEASMSRRGDCYDNAAMESFWGTLKTELVNHERYASPAAARASIFEYIEVFYNRIRRHSSLGYVSPEAFEASLN